MGKIRIKISDLPIRGYDRIVSNTFSSFFDLALGLGVAAYNSLNHQAYGNSYYSRSDYYRKKQTKKSYSKPKNQNFLIYKSEIEKLESVIANHSISMKQCDRLAYIYDMVGDHFNERKVRLIALELFLNECGEGHQFPAIVEAFNNNCKQPPDTICENELINEDYRLLLRKAESAKRKSYQFKKLYRP